MSAVQCISGHRSACAVLDKVLPNLPLRISPVNYLVRHEGREALIQPKIVPPFHSDEIPEPHVSNFMRDNFSDALLRRGTRVLVRMQQDLSKGYRAPVLHCPISELWDSDQVKLGQIIGNAEIFLVEFEGFLRRLESEAGLDLAIRLDNRSGIQLRLVMAILVLLKPANSDIEKIGGHLRSLLEGYRFLAPLLLLGFKGHVRDYREI